MVFVYTADHEEPKCERCDNMESLDCSELCGAENFWNLYQRTEYYPGKEEENCSIS